MLSMQRMGSNSMYQHNPNDEESEDPCKFDNPFLIIAAYNMHEEGKGVKFQEFDFYNGNIFAKIVDEPELIDFDDDFDEEDLD